MKFSALRQHNKINSNCQKLVQEYLEMLRIDNQTRATALRRRIARRYGKDIFEVMGIDPQNPESED